MGEPILDIQNLDAWRGSAHVLQGVNLSLTSGRLALVGRNGMGKTTLCEAIVGILGNGPDGQVRGQIRLAGKELTLMPPHQVARRGIGYVPQGRRVFRSLSTEENLRLVSRRGRLWTIERAYELFPRLRDRRRVSAGRLSGGEQQMLAIARALLLDPILLVMDEPSEGLAPVLVDQVVDACLRLADEGMHMLVVEQNLHVACKIADEIAVLANGRLVNRLMSHQFMSDSDAQRRYLGVSPLSV